MHILHNNDLIYTPGVTVFKSDTDMPEVLPEEEWYQVDVISCAAPRLRLRSSDQKKLGLTSDVLEIERETEVILTVNIPRLADTQVKKEYRIELLLSSHILDLHRSSNLIRT